MKEGNLLSSYEKAEELLEYCGKIGYTKHEYVVQMCLICRVLIKNELYFDALLKAEETLKICEKYNLRTDKIVSLICKAQVFLKLDKILESISIIKEIE